MSAELVSELLRVADRLPEHLRAWLISGLQDWQRGQDLESALQLHDDSPAIDLPERDDMLRVAIRLCPGESDGAQADYFIGVMSGTQTHPDQTGRQFVSLLKQSRVYIPTTVRHLRRILQGRRHDGWQCKSVFNCVPAVELNSD